jgi:hypothetical protein
MMMRRSTSAMMVGIAAAGAGLAVYLIFTFLTPLDFAASLVFGFTSPADWVVLPENSSGAIVLRLARLIRY